MDAGTSLRTSVLLVALLAVGSVGCERAPSPNNAPPLQVPAGVADPLPSWNDGANKKSILEFVARVTDKGGREFVPVEQRIATFDNDGTLWAEQPLYFQMLFMLEQVRAAAPKHPEWKTNSAFKALEAHDEKALAQMGHKPLLELIAVGNSGMSVDVYDRTIRDWLATARHPVTKRRFTDMVYQPMLELLAHLRANGFKTFIVSGGSVEFMRPWVERAYGIPPKQVIGSQTDVTFTFEGDQPTLTRDARIAFIDDGPGKPEGIYRHIGRRPIFAFGNSDGDQQMFQYTASGVGAHFVGLVHHTDGQREWAYDRESHVGRLAGALDEARRRNWTVVDMAADWKVIYPDEK